MHWLIINLRFYGVNPNHVLNSSETCPGIAAHNSEIHLTPQIGVPSSYRRSLIIS